MFRSESVKKNLDPEKLFFRIRIRNIPLSATGSTLLEYPILNGPLTSLSRKSHTVRCEIIFLGIEPYLFFYNIDCEALSNGHGHSFQLSEILNKMIKNSPCTSIKMYFTLYLQKQLEDTYILFIKQLFYHHEQREVRIPLRKCIQNCWMSNEA